MKLQCLKVRYAVLMMFALASCAMFAAESTSTSTVVADQPWYVQLIVGVVTTLITFYLIPYLKSQADVARAQVQAHQIDMNKSLIDQKSTLYEMAKDFALTRAASIGERRWPIIAQKILSKQINTIADVKDELKVWHEDLRKDMIAFFTAQNIDIVEKLGVNTLNQLIEYAANMVSPFPGKETAVAVLENNVAQTIIDRGVEYMRAFLTAPIVEASPV